jgi:hypothetical protein
MNLFIQIAFVLVFSVISGYLGWILAKAKFLGKEIGETDLREGDIVYVALVLAPFEGSAICVYRVYDGSKDGTSECLPRKESKLFECHKQLRKGHYYLWDGDNLTETNDENLIAPKS